MDPDDEYETAIDRAAPDAVRALLVVPHASPEGARGLRQVTSWLADTHGPDAVRDLAEALAARRPMTGGSMTYWSAWVVGLLRPPARLRGGQPRGRLRASPHRPCWEFAGVNEPLEHAERDRDARGWAASYAGPSRTDASSSAARAAGKDIRHGDAVRALTTSGEHVDGLAFNEVTTIRHSGQSANIRVSVDGAERLAQFVGDGLIIATPAGSTAYNLSAHGPIIPLGSPLLALTPVSPFRPRRWRGALLPDTATVMLENLDPAGGRWLRRRTSTSSPRCSR